MSGARYPDVQVTLIGHDGNAFAIMNAVSVEMRYHRIPRDEIEAFRREAMSGDYDNLIRTVMRWVSTDGEGDDE